MKTLNPDILIIGAGPGGYVAAIYAAKQGKSVILVDRRWIGGACLNEGCIPTKALVKSAGLYHDLLHGEDKGITATDIKLDLSKVIENKNKIKDKLISGIEYLLKKYEIEVIRGEAKFLNNEEVLVNADEEITIKAKDIIIATGSKTKHLPIKGLDLENVFDSETLLNNEHLPDSMTVIGAGIIGMEFAFIYAQMGVKVNVVEFLPRILPSVEKDVAQRLIRFAKQLNIDIYTSSAVERIEKTDEGLKVVFNRKEKEESLQSEYVLEAVGRAPQINNLDLDKTEVEFSEKSGVKVDEFMKTNVEHIYAIGDVTNIMQLAHVASHQGMIAVDNILGKEHKMKYEAIPWVIFTTPTIASVGLTEEVCKEKEIAYEMIKTPYSANGKALILEAETGFIKVLRKPETKAIIGATVFGSEAENLIASYGIAIENGLKSVDLQKTVFAHPTIQELVHESALGLDKIAIHYVD
jgi:dihydrolipoamide dehydrogenase